MPRQEQILTVFVASPSDVELERSRLEDVIRELNLSWSRKLGIRLDLVRWETHAYPGFGDDPQEVINRQIPADYDVFIGIMWHRFGTPTGRAGSGTEEEFLRAKARWDSDHSSVDLMIYFKDAPVPPSQIDASQLSKAKAFRESLGDEGGLYWPFQSTDDFANLLRMHLTAVVQKWQSRLSVAGGDAAPNSGIAARSPVGSSEIVDEEEPGILELSEESEEKFLEATDVITRIVKATEAIGKKIHQHAQRVQAATATGSVKRTAAKRLLSKAAKDINDYAAKLNRDVPLLRESLEGGQASLSKAISLLPEIAAEDQNRDQVEEWLSVILGLRQIMSTAAGHIQEFSDTVNRLPWLTTELNRARRSLVAELQGLIELLRVQDQMLAQTEAAVRRLLGKQAGI
jgi:hypothetical protein